EDSAGAARITATSAAKSGYPNSANACDAAATLTEDAGSANIEAAPVSLTAKSMNANSAAARSARAVAGHCDDAIATIHRVCCLDDAVWHCERSRANRAGENKRHRDTQRRGRAVTGQRHIVTDTR